MLHRPLGGDDGHADALLHDATLQPGDSVMTAKGVRVFVGGCPHRDTDFLALAEIRSLPKHERRALAAIDKVINTRRVAVQVGGFAAVGARTDGAGFEAIGRRLMASHGRKCLRHSPSLRRAS